MKFWDASAIIPLCLEQPLSNSLKKIAQEDSLAVWWGTPVECCCAFARLRREKRLTEGMEKQARVILERFSEIWTEIKPTQLVREKAQRILLLHPLRAADSSQLAAALIWAEERPAGKNFVCLDRRLGEAAAREGFVIAP